MNISNFLERDWNTCTSKMWRWWFYMFWKLEVTLYQVIMLQYSWLVLFKWIDFVSCWCKIYYMQLLSGGNHDIDVDDLRKNTRYTGGYSDGSRTIKIFWEIIKGFEPKERCMLLKFVTSCSRPPLLGFKHLQPSFTIHKVGSWCFWWLY